MQSISQQSIQEAQQLWQRRTHLPEEADALRVSSLAVGQRQTSGPLPHLRLQGQEKHTHRPPTSGQEMRRGAFKTGKTFSPWTYSSHTARMTRGLAHWKEQAPQAQEPLPEERHKGFEEGGLP